MLDHVAVEAARFALLLFKPLIHVLRHTMTGRAVVELLLVVVEFIRPRARRAKLRVQASAAPRGLDDEHRLLQRRLHREAKSELGADLAIRFRRIVPRAIARRELPSALAIRAAVVFAGEVGDPGVIAHTRLALLVAHHLQQRRRRRIIADVIKGLDLRMTLHVRLPGEDEDLQWRGLERCRDEE
jgi:hypothetical protein